MELGYAVLLLRLASSLAHLDLFISQDEMKRLMGIEGELWYVDNGIVNREAAEYEMEILSGIDFLQFSWANRHTEPISYWINVHYNPDQSSSISSASVVNIPSTGVLEPTPSSDPTDSGSSPKPNTFQIRLPRCELSQPLDFRITVGFEFDWSTSSNTTTLELHRRKRCPNFFSGSGSQDEEEFDGSGQSDSESNMKRKKSEISYSFLGSATNLFYISIGCLFGFLLILASAIIVYFSRATDRTWCCTGDGTGKSEGGDDVVSSLLAPAPRNPPMMTSTPMDTQVQAQTSIFRRSCASVTSSSALSSEKRIGRSASPSTLSKCASAVGGTSFVSAVTDGGKSNQHQQQHQRHSASVCESIPPVCHFRDKELNVDETVKRLLMDQDDVELGIGLLEGTFGEILTGRIRRNTRYNGKKYKENRDEGGREDEEWMEVIVKTMKEKAADHQIDRFLHESLGFIDLPHHPNVILPIAVSMIGNDDSPGRYAVHFPHDGYGNLKRFLLRCRGADSANIGTGLPSMVLSTQDLVYAAVQIIRGLLHLHKFRILHRDMAARNCIVGRDLTIQICDTGLARDLFPQDYHCLGDNENRPIKWMSFESLEKSEFSTASDVWAFGVTLWELTTLAQQPYTEVDPYEMQAHLTADQRLAQPYNCPDELYLLMYCCWNLHQKARPTFSQLLAAMEDFYAQLTQYI